jgi:hypothetical protein
VGVSLGGDSQDLAWGNDLPELNHQMMMRRVIFCFV